MLCTLSLAALFLGTGEILGSVVAFLLGRIRMVLGAVPSTRTLHFHGRPQGYRIVSNASNAGVFNGSIFKAKNSE